MANNIRAVSPSLFSPPFAALLLASSSFSFFSPLQAVARRSQPGFRDVGPSVAHHVVASPRFPPERPDTGARCHERERLPAARERLAVFANFCNVRARLLLDWGGGRGGQKKPLNALLGLFGRSLRGINTRGRRERQAIYSPRGLFAFVRASERFLSELRSVER